MTLLLGAQCGHTGIVRAAFAHDAVLTMESGADIRAPGAAVTVALCGHWEHEPPCPLAPHHTSATRVGDDVHVRTLFAVESGSEDEVRQRIDTALSAGRIVGPDGEVTGWLLRSTRRSAVRDTEADQVNRLSRS